MKIEINPKGTFRRGVSFRDRLGEIRRQLAVAARLVWFEVKSRQFGRVLGLIWLLIDPLLFAGLYLFITKVIFSFSATNSTHDFLFILTAVTTWRWFSRTVDASPSVIPGYGGILKQTNFPLGILISVAMGVELFSFLLSFGVMMAVTWAYGIPPHWTVAWVPLLVVVQGVFTAALALLGAVAGVFVKDLAGFLYVITSIWFYVSPGIYPVDKIPASLRPYYDLNPFATLFPAWRCVIIDHAPPPVAHLLLLLAGSTAILLIALVLLRRTRHLFFRLV